MIDSNDFILNSDLATFKNDSSGNVFSVTIPSGFTFTYANPILGTDTQTVGTINAGMRCHAFSSRYPSMRSVGPFLVSDMSVNITGQGAATITLYCSLNRISPDQLQLQVSTEGGVSPTITVTQTQTITFVVSTFLSPFD